MIRGVDVFVDDVVLEVLNDQVDDLQGSGCLLRQDQAHFGLIASIFGRGGLAGIPYGQAGTGHEQHDQHDERDPQGVAAKPLPCRYMLPWVLRRRVRHLA